MPATATAPRNNNEPLTISGSLPKGMSDSSGELHSQTIGSRDRFYGDSRSVASFFSGLNTPVVLETTSVVEGGIGDILHTTMTRINNLLMRQDGWNGYDVPAPNWRAIALASEWIVWMYLAAADAQYSWADPNVTSGADGEVVFEWWHGSRKLTIYVSPETVEYVQVWGPDVNTQMEDGEAESFSACQALWSWLMVSE